jgi:putrescine transport system ATP-binding protein
MADSVFAPWRDPQAKPLIQFKGVTKRFGDFTAIDDLTQDIFECEFFALLGPSGCGKTTLMRMLAGFETPTEGQILLNGRDIGHIPPNKRAVNMMFQSYALFPHLSVFDNIAFGLRRESRNKADITARVQEMLRLTRLERFANRKPHQISGGQRQRVALARSLAKAPKLLLLDEPLGALDRKLREETQFELMDIQEKTGTTFIIVTHDQEEAMTVASRVAVMNEGKIVQVATPDVIYEAPNSVYVADFIGDVNLIRGTATPRKIAEAPPEKTPAAPSKPTPPPVLTPATAPAIAEPPAQGPRPNALGRKLHDKLLSRVFGSWIDEEPRRLPPPAPEEIEVVAPTPNAAPTVSQPDLPEGGLEISWAPGEPSLIAANGDAGLADAAVVLSVRPEKIAISKDRPLAPNTVKGKVIDIAYLGNISTYHVEVAGGLMIKAQAANTRRISRRDITWEDEVWLSFSATAGVVLKDV